MLTQSLPLVIPPAPKVHAKDLPVWHHLLLAQRNNIGIFPDYAFDVPFARRTAGCLSPRSITKTYGG